MEFAIKPKANTTKQKSLISFKYIKSPCHLYKKHVCEMIIIVDEIERKAKPMSMPSIEYFYHRHEMHQYYLYLAENINGEITFVAESHCLKNKNQNIKTAYEFLVRVFHFLREAKTKDKIRGLRPIISRVKYLMKRETKRLRESRMLD